MTSNPQIMIVAGEASGDKYGAWLTAEIRRRRPSARFFGMGGALMRGEQVETLVNADDMAVFGLVEIIAHAGTIRRAYGLLKGLFTSRRPDLLILIDYQEFNQLLAAAAKRAGVRVLFYISPQVWAWRPGRVKKMARIVDHMAVLFPFEVPLYEQAGVPVTFVGHPLLDIVTPTMTRDEAFGRFGLDPDRPVVGLFPGSRRSELKFLFQTILDSARILKEQYPELQFVLPLAPSFKREDIAASLQAAGLEVTIIQGLTYDVMQLCDAVITVSGTVTLELALMAVPMVIIYRVAPLTYAIGKRLVKIDHAGICNIVAGERVVKELIQDEAKPGAIVAEIGRMLDDAVYRETIRGKLAGVRAKLGSGGCSARLAEVAIQLLERKQGTA
jgi:lipid-A-disaccharide synthase